MWAPGRGWWAARLLPTCAGVGSYRSGAGGGSVRLPTQIDDDENVAETIIVEIHADNEESFIDKNVTLTVFKIGESPGTD